MTLLRRGDRHPLQVQLSESLLCKFHYAMVKRQTMAKVVKDSSHFRQLTDFFLERKVDFAIILFYVGYIAVFAYCFVNGIEMPDVTGFE